MGRLLSYILLLAGGSLFLFPLVWMVSTSLKPVEQTNVTPPQWIPYAHEAELSGRLQPIMRGQELREPKWIVEVLNGPLAHTRRLVDEKDFTASEPGPTPAGRAHLYESGGLDVNARVIKRAEAGWYVIRERTSGDVSVEKAAWDVVPPQQIHSRP
jgi:ABC-type glycerol-3-phosphate transport system permease component